MTECSILDENVNASYDMIWKKKCISPLETLWQKNPYDYKRGKHENKNITVPLNMFGKWNNFLHFGQTGAPLQIHRPLQVTYNKGS